MRAPAISPASKPLRWALALAALVLAATLTSASAVADESAVEPQPTHDDATLASTLGDSDARAADQAVAGTSTLASYLASGELRLNADVALADDDPDPVVGSFTVDGLTYAVVGEGRVVLVAAAPGTIAGGLADGSVDVSHDGSAGAEGRRGIGSGWPTSSPRSAAEQVPSGAQPQPAPSAEADGLEGDAGASLARIAGGAAAGLLAGGAAGFDGVLGESLEGNLALQGEEGRVSSGNSPDGELADGSGADGASVLVLSEAVEHGGATYTLVAIGPRAFAGCDAAAVVLPASVASVDEAAFRGSSVAAVEVADGNPYLSSYDGMLFDADLSSLLLIPEGKQGAARIPKEAVSVPPDAFSHSASVTSVSVEAGSAAYLSRNGCLYDASGETLLWAPADAIESVRVDGFSDGLVAFADGFTTCTYYSASDNLIYSHYIGFPGSGDFPSTSVLDNLQLVHQGTVTRSDADKAAGLWPSFEWPDSEWFMLHNGALWCMNKAKNQIWSIGTDTMKSGVACAYLRKSDKYGPFFLKEGEWTGGYGDDGETLWIFPKSSYTVTWSSDGVTKKTESKGPGTLSQAPVVSKEDFTLLGWYSKPQPASAFAIRDPEGKLRVCGASGYGPEVKEDVTYYAWWRLNQNQTGSWVSVRSPNPIHYGSYGATSGAGTTVATPDANGNYYYGWHPTYVRWVRDNAKGLSYLEMYCGDYYWDFPIGLTSVVAGVAHATLDGKPITAGTWYRTTEKPKEGYELWLFGDDKVKLTWDANGGTMGGSSTSSTDVTYGAKSMVPTPAREGYVFMGWYEAKSALDDTGDPSMGTPACTGGSESFTPALYKPTTYYAHWRLAEGVYGKRVEVKSFSQFQYGNYRQATTGGAGTKVQVKDLEGAYQYGWKATRIRWVKDDAAGLSYLEEQCGDYWWDFPLGFTEVTKGIKRATIDGEAMSPNTWYETTSKEREVWIFDKDEFTVTWSDPQKATTTASSKVVAGSTVASPAPSKDKYAFLGWCKVPQPVDALGIREKRNESVACAGGASTPPIRQDVTYHAWWTLAEPSQGQWVNVRSFSQFQYGAYGQASGTGTKASAREEDGSYRYSWRPTYVRWVQKDVVGEGGATEHLSYLEEYCGDYWWDFPLGFTEVTKGIKRATLDGTAMEPNVWYKTTDKAEPYELWIFDVDEVSLTWDANGGYVAEGDTSSIEVAPGTKSMVPTPARYGYAFVGWYDASGEDGSLVCTPGEGNLTPPLRRDTTYYAHWTLITNVELPITATEGVVFELGVPDGEIRVAGTQENPQAEASGWLRSKMPVEMQVSAIASELEAEGGAEEGVASSFWRGHDRFADLTLRLASFEGALRLPGGGSLSGNDISPALVIPAATGKPDGTLDELGELQVLYGLSLDRLFADPSAGGAGVDITELLPQGEGASFAVPQALMRLVFTVEAKAAA